ncbi:butyrophilin subfamily 1 member A1-like [Ovis canadensis]|uniref:butyrophilin subfamily 1 member A1-like n=1 Tax=Ovis canadensis TaxID=37174 RepID=UPI0037520C4E
MISVHFQGKPFNFRVIRVYAPTTNAGEAEVEQFYDDLQDLLELIPKKEMSESLTEGRLDGTKEYISLMHEGLYRSTAIDRVLARWIILHWKKDYNLGDRIPESSEELFQRELNKEIEQLKKEIERKKAQFKSAWREIPLYADWRKEEFQTVKLTLDAATAHPALFLSEEGRIVTWQEPCQELPSSPERFVSIPCVLGQLYVSSGRYFWEVEVQDAHSWDLGVCRNNVARTGRVTMSPQNGFWVIRLYDGEYWGLTSPETSLTLKEKPCRVGVFLDYEAGDVSFYNMTDESHIYTFSKQAFYGGLRPLFRLWSSDSGPLVIVQVEENTTML